MTTYKATKLEARMRGIFGILVGIFFASFALLLSLMEGSQFTPATSIMLPLFLCFFVEAAYSISKKSVFRSEKWEPATSSDSIERVGKGLNIFFLIKAILKNIKGFLILLFLAVGAGYFLMNYEMELQWTQEFFIQITTYLVYVLILRRILVPVMTKLRKLAQKLLPSYELDASGVTFILTDKNRPHPDQKSTIRVDFHEIDELKLLNYQEAKSYMKYEFSADLKKLSSGAKDYYLFLKDNIRPRVYTKILSGGAAVLLRGQGNFYLITVNKDDCQDLVDSYKKSKMLA